MSANVRARILAEIEAERARQDMKWGEQNHPDVWPHSWHEGVTPRMVAKEFGVPEATHARANCDWATQRGVCTWAHILVEEVAEVVEAAVLDDKLHCPVGPLDRELVQLAAVCVSWLEARSRRRAGGAL